METGHLPEFEQKIRRPHLLSLLCVLSFIGSALSAVSGFFVYINYRHILELMQSDGMFQLGEQLRIIQSIPREFFLIAALLNVVSFVGVRFMWMLQKAGFHLYAISQLLIIIFSSVYIYKPAGVFPGFDLMLTTLFILMYLRFRDIMS
ncbi:MAG: hypothetical protein IPM52_12135 [Bacteroidetes bacterium]|nr:hypothetical protein [Bacteroidota bacterium]